MVKNTPLTEIHQSLGAKMAPFAGYNMPIQYSGIKEEHHAVREKLGVFDVSHMGEFIVRGPQAFDLVQYVTSNDVSKLAPGQAQYSCLPRPEGGIVDDLLVYHLDEGMTGHQAYMLVVNASNIEKDWNWIQQYTAGYDCEMVDISENTGLIAVQGPLAAKALQTLTEVDLNAIKYYTFVRGSIAGVDNVLISATGYTGAGGFELYAEASKIVTLWQKVFEAGAPMGVVPAGLGARDTLRLEMGFCLYGNDIDDTTTPLEAGLGWITKLKKGDFVGKAHLEAQKANGLSKKLVGFVLEDRRVPRHGYAIENADGQTIGEVTSGTASPSLEKSIGMGYVPLTFTEPGTRLMVNVGSKSIPATVTTLPFYNAG